MRVLAFTGLPGSGKSEAIAAVQAREVPVVRMGDFVLQEVRSRGLPEQEEHIGPVATGMREAHGQDVWARRTLDHLKERRHREGSSLVVVDGVRSPAEIEAFRRELGEEFVLVAVDAPAKLRHERILGRGRTDDARELRQVEARDEREKSWGLEQAIERADHRIENTGEKTHLRASVDALLKRLAPEAF